MVLFALRSCVVSDGSFKGQLQMVAPGVERLSLRTPTLLPATETNTYFVTVGDHFYVIEPATPYEAEQRALLSAIREKIRSGLSLRGQIVTHHHGDHVGAAMRVRDEFDAPVMAHAHTKSRLEGRVSVDVCLDEGESLFDGCVEVLHTPGHARGHLCLRERAGNWLIAGDMVASVGTILIDVDDGGDMREYVAQLERLAALVDGSVLPAHGAPIEQGAERLRYYVQHRLAREAKVLAALDAEWSGEETIVAKAYDDAPPALWPIAARSARAHLEKLRHERRVEFDGERWRAL
jgi:glyoxylase-like metal-dependent hydrolase (beta-lactamase superfamily II)